MKGLVPINELFDAIYGVNLELLNLDICNRNDPNSIRFISRKDNDNGLAAYVKQVDGITPNPAHTISVAVSGSVLSSFYQDEEYYSGRDIYYLKPRRQMTVEEMLFYAFCLTANKYKYNYGRGANRTLKQILVPKSMPIEFKRLSISEFEIPKQAPIISEEIELKVGSWDKFVLNELFTVKKGKRLTKEDMNEGDTPFIGAIDSNNGWREFIGQPALHTGHTITVNYNGNGVAEAFYQPVGFWASDDVNVLYPKFAMNIYSALFIAAVIRHEKYRFNYGRKWHSDRMVKSVIKLPAANGKPDFLFMEKYMKSLPFSPALEGKGEVQKARVKKVNERGLTDEQLIEKYVGGKVPMKKMMKAMLTTPPPEESLKGKTKK